MLLNPNTERRKSNTLIDVNTIQIQIQFDFETVNTIQIQIQFDKNLY